MQLVRSAVLYTALALCANGALAAPPDLAPYLQGDMRKLMPVDPPGDPVEAVVIDEADRDHALADYRGKYVLLNFWATWCAPCRSEMPALDRVQADFGGDRFAVVTVATGRNPVPAIGKFFAEAGIAHLPKLRDPKQAFAHQMGVMGLPVSIILDPEGREIARLIGDAAWDGPEARALFAALAAAE